MGDLNLLKSWNPKLVKNRKKVWEIEQERLKEELKLKERQIEIQKEKELSNLISHSNKQGKNATQKKKTTGLEWMYDTNDKIIEKETNDSYLLGRKKLDTAVLNSNKRRNVKDNGSNTPTNAKKKIDYTNDDPMSKLSNMNRTIRKKKKVLNSKNITKK